MFLVLGLIEAGCEQLRPFFRCSILLDILVGIGTKGADSEVEPLTFKAFLAPLILD